MSAQAPAACLQVALPVPLPRLFDYLPPPGERVDAGWVGCRVRVRLGQRPLVGVVAGIGRRATDAPGVLRPVGERLDATPVLAGELLDSLRWAATYYHAPPGEMLALALPATLRTGETLPEIRRMGWRLKDDAGDALDRLRPGAGPHRLAARLRTAPVDDEVLDRLQPGWRAAMRSLVGRGLVERVPIQADAPLAHEGPRLNPEQAEAAAALREALGRFQPVLLEGVTGSGKTEVYLDAVQACLERGRQALVLVPEIGLTPQTLERFQRRLGQPVHALHSGLSDGERARTWASARSGLARVVVGTRSAIFTPLPEAGLIVVDEEHDTSYKQHDGVRYSARDLALVRARALGVPVVLGSATPSLESLAHARSGRYVHLRLTGRAGGAQAPAVGVLDVRKRPLEAGLSPELLQAVGTCLDEGGQVLVFRNRRGYAPVLTCHDCGWTADCRHCDARMTVHASGRRLVCHHCGARGSAPPACPDCGGLALQPQGAGTERIEDALAERFPNAKLLRIDRASTRGRDALHRRLAGLGDGPGILVGTQMLAKGHDLPNLRLVCVVGIDEGLFSADFRAPERLAQLLIQVAGRAGRARHPGRVLLQTHHPAHPLLETLLSGGYPAFAAEALQERRSAGFPPFHHLALLRAEATSEAAARAFLDDAAARVRAWLQRQPAPLELMGPLPAPMARRAGRSRVQLLLSAPARPPLQACLSALVPTLYEGPLARPVRWSVDVDPQDLY
ncbi:MAG: primosomal protein N' [Lysobacteraceae bacterium]